MIVDKISNSKIIVRMNEIISQWRKSLAEQKMMDINHVEADNILNNLRLFFITECVHKAWVTAMYRCRAIAKIVRNEINTKIQDNVSNVFNKDSVEEIMSRNIQKNELMAVHRSTRAKFRTKTEQVLGSCIPNSRKPFKRIPSVEIIIRHISCTSSDFTSDCASCNVSFLRSHISIYMENNQRWLPISKILRLPFTCRRHKRPILHRI
jgi:hypothetical protein